MRKRMTAFLLLILLTLGTASGETLRYGMRGDAVQSLQKALIREGHLDGEADGIFGRRTEKAVRRFQKEHGLKADGLAGEKTQAALLGKSAPAPRKKAGYFSDDYATIQADSGKKRIRLLQKALITMDYLMSSADGIYGSMTSEALKKFQKAQGLKADGVAGEKTLSAIESALAEGHRAEQSLKSAAPLAPDAGRIAAPDKASIQLLHWYNDIKPKLKSNSRLLIYEPVSRLAWTLKVHSRGRHCDAEPLTLEDTQIMLKAFGNKNTWNQKGVYVLLPDGRWTVGTTHTAPHLTGYIKDNGFDGHLCVHFFRDMEECSKMDPVHGVSNQNTIRSLWYRVSGETIKE